ncbi:MAG: NAD(P)H-dependent oxidoreductase [Acidobacteria bacterium]|nr:NAD(P)H-dependent oxidoreductase [Acidobacteriota bacterium]
MNVVILYAHPNPESYNHAVLEAVRGELAAAGHAVTVRDLYALGFDPVLKGADFAAFKVGETPGDIAREQAFIRDADLVVAVHPVWWFNQPAILKGYIDRVFSYGFAYAVGANGIEPLLKGKKAAILNTTGGDEAVYVNYGFKDALLKTLDAGIYGFCGMEVVLHHFFHAVPQQPREKLAADLADLKALVREKLAG